MNSIQEALRQLRSDSLTEDFGQDIVENSYEMQLVEAKKSRHANTLLDLWDQVYCSLTDGGYNNTYKALGKLNGKGKYDVAEVGGSDIRPGFDTIVVTNPNTDAAEEVAKVYGLEYRIVPGKRIYIYVPEGAPVNTDLLTPAWRDAFVNNTKAPKGSEDDTDESIDEDFDSSLPVQPLPHDVVYDFIENVPVAGDRRPPVFFPVGYMREVAPQAKFRGGRGSEGNPVVRIIKCSEMTVWTGSSYESHQAVKDMRKATGKERTGNRTGFSFSGENSIVNKIGISSRGEEQLQCTIKNGTKPKAKYFISIDGGDFYVVDKNEVAQYLTPANADALLNGREVQGDRTMTLKLSNIYRIGPNGNSVM